MTEIYYKLWGNPRVKKKEYYFYTFLYCELRIVKKIYFRIAEFAQLCGTTKDTLIHYDTIGILKPRYVGENKYRYYEVSQFERFYFISGLKDLGFSLEYIKTQITIQPLSAHCDVLKKQEKVIEEKIQRLKATKQSVRKNIEKIEDCLKQKKGHVCIHDMPKQFCILSKAKLDFQNTITEAHGYFTQLLTKLKEYSKNNYHSYGFIKTREQIDANENFLYENLYFNAPEDISDYIIPQGRYLVLYEETDFDDILPSYHKIIDFARENNIEIEDIFYENLVLSQIGTGDENNTYIVQLRSKIKE